MDIPLALIIRGQNLESCGLYKERGKSVLPFEAEHGLSFGFVRDYNQVRSKASF